MKKTDCRSLNPLYFGSLVPTIYGDNAEWNRCLNPLYFGSLVPTLSEAVICDEKAVLIPFISGLWFLHKAAGNDKAAGS